MVNSKNWLKIKDLLKIAGYINMIIAIGHLVGLIRAKQLFEATGIGEEMNELAQVHFLFPYALTLFVSIVFFAFGLYAFSAAGKIKKLPFLRFAIFAIAGIYLFRGAGGLLIEVTGQEASAPSEIMYSLIALAIGFLFLYGGINKWNRKKDIQSRKDHRHWRDCLRARWFSSSSAKHPSFSSNSNHTHSLERS